MNTETKHVFLKNAADRVKLFIFSIFTRQKGNNVCCLCISTFTDPSGPTAGYPQLFSWGFSQSFISPGIPYYQQTDFLLLHFIPLSASWYFNLRVFNFIAIKDIDIPDRT